MINKMTEEFTISSKLRFQDTATIEGESKKVAWFLVNDPKAIWKAVHTKGSQFSLTRDVYHILKESIKKDYPDLYLENERKKRLVASKRKFRKFEGKFNRIRVGKPTIKST